MSLLSLCRSAAADVAVLRKDAGSCASERKTEKTSIPDPLVVRYSALQEPKKSDFPKISEGVSDRSTLQDELGIMRLEDRQTVTFCLKKRGKREEKTTKDAEKEKLQQKRTKEAERERYVALVRSRVMEFIKEMIYDVKNERIKGQTPGAVTEENRAPHIRPHTVDTPGSRMVPADNCSRPHTDSGTHPYGRFDHRLTDEDKKALRSMLGEILKRKLREGGWSQGSGVSRELSNFSRNSNTSSKRHRRRHQGASMFLARATPTSKSRESSSVTMTRESKDSMTSSKRHRGLNTKDSARRASRIGTSKQNGIGQLAEKSLQLLRERVRESAARVIREQKEVAQAGDTIVDSHNENGMKVIFNHQNSRSHPQLYGLRNTSKNSTADWVMRQDFEQFKDEEVRDVTTEQNDVHSATKA